MCNGELSRKDFKFVFWFSREVYFFFFFRLSPTHTQRRSMVVSENMEHALVQGIRPSSVVPRSITGDYTYEPSNMDLAMKLHYIRVVYLFRQVEEFEEAGSSRSITAAMLKESMFTWLDYYFETCGRFRRSETTGRPYIKCNDCGVRVIEAKSAKTVDEWMMMKDTSAHRLLVPHQVLGPDLPFSPTTLMQLTFLKCGGIAIGLSWAHVLGDAFSLAEYMNAWARVMLNHSPLPLPPPNLSKCRARVESFPSPQRLGSGPLALRRVGPVGDHWIQAVPPNPSGSSSTTKLATYSIHLTSEKLAQLQEKVFGRKGTSQWLPPIESICAVVWQAIAKSTKDGRQQPDMVTVIKKDRRIDHEIAATTTTTTTTLRLGDDHGLKNDQLVSTVKVPKAEFSIVEAHTKDLAALIHDQAVDERAQIAELMEKEGGMADFIIYGANLTLVNWEEAPLYEFRLMGAAPSLVNCFVDGIGEEGVVLVLPAGIGSAGSAGAGRLVTLILPEAAMSKLKNELKQGWSIE
ncbi:hypothetical protein Dimus_002210 [Dionaea muscipula]